MKGLARSIGSTRWVTLCTETSATVLKTRAQSLERQWGAGPGRATHGISITTVFRTYTSPMEWFLEAYRRTSTAFSGARWWPIHRMDRGQAMSTSKAGTPLTNSFDLTIPGVASNGTSSTSTIEMELSPMFPAL